MYPATTVNREHIATMVVIFYTKVLKDEMVGPFFIAKLGDDLESDYWKPHIETLINFWSSMILQDGTYGGNPLAPHFSIGELNHEVFKQWLKLFFETVDEVFIPKIGAEFKERSEIIAGNFMRNLRVSVE
ncbi:MAG: group III truncated hemoglobin [Sulfurovaceae bacterium]|nr:group III truncated hemoglobin [Sulfurovaceae bacterium]